MASSGDVALPVARPVVTPFDKIHKLYKTANQKIVKLDDSEIKINPEFQVTVTGQLEILDSPPLSVQQKKQLKKKKKKDKRLERKNNIVPRNETQLQATPSNSGGTFFIAYMPPIDWHVNAYLLYFGDIFKALEKMINEKIKVG